MTKRKVQFHELAKLQDEWQKLSYGKEEVEIFVKEALLGKLATQEDFEKYEMECYNLGCLSMNLLQHEPEEGEDLTYIGKQLKKLSRELQRVRTNFGVRKQLNKEEE